MKVAITIGHFPIGGVGTSTYILARGMREAGHQADIIATDGLMGGGYHEAQENGWPVEAICLGERWLKRRLDIALDHLSKYDVVINNHSPETRLLLPALPSRTIRLSVIRSTNDPVIAEGKASSPYLNALVGISPEVLRLLQVAKVACRTEMIPNAVTIFPSEFPDLHSPLRLAYLGRLTEVDKNILILPEIARVCKERGIKFTLDVAGDGKDRQLLTKTIRVREVSDCVRLHGVLSRDRVGDFLNQRSFGLFPSNYEGFGLSLVEAMGVGCVPIASDIPSYRWILGEDADTLLAPVKDAQAYADRLFALATNPEHYRQIQQRLQRRQQDCFSPASTVSEYLRLIEELRQTHDLTRFSTIPLAKLSLPSPYRRQCSRAWWLLQKIKDGMRNPAQA